MRYLDRLINFIFSFVILVLSIIVIMVSAGFVEYNVVDTFIRNNIFSDANNTITCIVAIITLLASLKTTFFLSKLNKNKKSALMVDTTHGKIQISSETIENTAKSAIVDYKEIKDVQVRMVKEKKGINVYMMLLVLPNTNIIELSASVQDAVKEAIEGTTGIKVNNVDIKVKNMADTKKLKVKENENVKPQEIIEDTAILNEVTELKGEVVQAENNEEIVQNQAEAQNINENKENE